MCCIGCYMSLYVFMRFIYFHMFGIVKMFTIFYHFSGLLDGMSFAHCKGLPIQIDIHLHRSRIVCALRLKESMFDPTICFMPASNWVVLAPRSSRFKHFIVSIIAESSAWQALATDSGMDICNHGENYVCPSKAYAMTMPAQVDPSPWQLPSKLAFKQWIWDLNDSIASAVLKLHWCWLAALSACLLYCL